MTQRQHLDNISEELIAKPSRWELWWHISETKLTKARCRGIEVRDG